MDGQTVSLGKFRFKVNSRVGRFAMALAIVFALTLLTTHAVEAQTFSVLHNFSGEDGEFPYAGVTVGPGGVLYGTAAAGGTHGYGTVFRLTHIGSSWVVGPLYEFTGGSDGANPEGGVVIGPSSALYGTTTFGGVNYGIVFELRPPATFCRAILCYWSEIVLHTFTGPDGEYPEFENLAFDQAGDIYGTTWKAGTYAGGTAFELTPSDGGYTESTLHSFGSGDGLWPAAGVVLDTAGNVYGTTSWGGIDTFGTVYQLVPSRGGWLENVLVNFDGPNGEGPLGNLIIDASGNLYGTTSGGGERNGDSVVFKLAPSEGGFTYSALYSFGPYCDSDGGVAMDAAGNFFGVCSGGGAHQDGWIFELTNCSETCIANDLHDFSGSDGASPYGGPVLDANDNLYGTTQYGGNAAIMGGSCYPYGCGVVWEIAGAGSRP
ncbi:MAG: choice-of-anchor tandem repeat GloVer-containing protein [Candidatus Korobacteraceae bacterium]|jgi:hypothetical protein